MSFKEPERGRPKSRQTPVIAGCCVGVPLVIVAIFTFIYATNNRPIHVALPTPRIPNPNAYDDFVRAGKLANGMKHKTPNNMPTLVVTYAGFKAAAKDAQPALAVMRGGFRKESLYPPVRTVADTMRPRTELAAFRGLAREQAGVGMYYEMDGNYAKEADAHLDGIEMAVMVPRGGGLIHCLVGIACEAIAMSRFEQSLPFLTDADLAHVATRLDAIAVKRTPIADIIQEAGYSDTIEQEQTFNNPGVHGGYDTIREMLADDDPANPGSKRPLNVQQQYEAVKFVLSDKSQIIRDNLAYATACSAAARGVYRGPFRIPVPNNVFAKTYGGIFSQVREKYIAMVTAQSILRVEVALYRYKFAHGHYPATLSALAPQYIKAENLIDPCGGGALKYSSLQNGTAFQLYSIGPDMVDNGGIPTKSVGDMPGDIIAGNLWKKGPIPLTGK